MENEQKIDPVQFGQVVQAVRTNAETIAKFDEKLDSHQATVLKSVADLTNKLDSAHRANARRIGELETFKNNVKTATRFSLFGLAGVAALFNFESVSGWLKSLMRG